MHQNILPYRVPSLQLTYISLKSLILLVKSRPSIPIFHPLGPTISYISNSLTPNYLELRHNIIHNIIKPITLDFQIQF